MMRTLKTIIKTIFKGYDLFTAISTMGIFLAIYLFIGDDVKKFMDDESNLEE